MGFQDVFMIVDRDHTMRYRCRLCQGELNFPQGLTLRWKALVHE